MMEFKRNLKRGSRGADVREVQRALHCIADGIFGNITDEAVRDWQAAHGLAVDGIVGRNTWDSLFPTPAAATALKKSKRNIDLIVVHCTATVEGKDYTVDDVRKWHKARGFTDIGYHYLIYRDGSIHAGRNVNLAGAHTAGYNGNSIGVCYVGGLASDAKTPKDTRTEAQKAALLRLLTDLRKLYPHASIHGHREFAAKACPCFDARTEYKNL